MIRPLVAITLFAALAAGCARQIGDNCTVNVDCSPLGDRFCDISAPGGYCTMEGCDYASCPDDAVCVRFFSPLPCKLCNSKADCGADERCVCDQADPQDAEICLRTAEARVGASCDSSMQKPGYYGHCAPESSERRWCQKRCEEDGDCRSDSGYECRQTGTRGAEPFPQPTTGAKVSAKFCVQRGR